MGWSVRRSTRIPSVLISVWTCAFTCSPRGSFICSISRLQNLRGKRREKKMCRRRERARCRPAPSATRRSPQTPSMTAAKSREASIAHVANVWTTVDGRDGSSRPPSQNHADATSAEQKTDDWKLSIVSFNLNISCWNTCSHVFAVYMSRIPPHNRKTFHGL